VLSFLTHISELCFELRSKVRRENGTDNISDGISLESSS